MKKNLQKALAIVLAGAMVASFAACGDNGSTPATSTAPAASTETKTETKTDAPAADVAVAGIDGFTPFDNTVTLTIPVYQRATPNGAPDAGDNYWTKWIQENFGAKYNVDVQFVTIPRGTENEFYALQAAAGTLPTVCFEYDYPDVALYNSEGYFQPYDVEWFKSIAPTYWQQMVDNGLDAYTQLGGEDVLLVGNRPYGKSTYTFVTFYRKDWVEAAGYDVYPSDPDEELKMLAKLKELGLGGDHILGGSKIEGNGADQNHAWRSYPLDEELWAATGDYVVPALSTEAQKLMLKYENKKFNAGYIDPEYYTRQGADNDTDFINGKTIAYSCYAATTNTILDQFYAANPDAKLAIRYNPGPETYACGASTAFRAGGAFGQYIGFSSQATPDEMKAFAMYLEWMIQPENLFTLQWGFEGKNFDYVDGKPVARATDAQDPEVLQGHNNNVDMWCLVTAIRVLGDIETDIAAVCPTGYPDSDEFYADMLKNFEGQVKCFDSGLVSVDCMFTVAIEASDEYKDTLFSKYAELRDKIVMGSEADFEANYEAASAEYLAAGYQAIMDDRIAALKAGNSSRLAK